MQLMGHGVLFMDEYNPISIHIGGWKKKNPTVVTIYSQTFPKFDEVGKQLQK